MRLVIDTDKEFPQLAGDVRQLFLVLKAKHGWEGLSQLIQMPVTELALQDWEAKSKQSMGRLKRICRAIETTTDAAVN